MNHILLVLLWVFWCFLHSLLIAPSVTGWMSRSLGEWFRFYRLFYNVFSLATLIPLIHHSLSLRGEPIFQWPGSWAILRHLLIAIAVGLFVAGARHYRLSQFLGIHPIRRGSASFSLAESNHLETSGILSAIRHPWYTAGILLLWAWEKELSLASLLVNSVLTAYFVIGAFLEERKLALTFGERYREYQKAVSMFFPYKWLKRRLSRGSPIDGR